MVSLSLSLSLSFSPILRHSDEILTAWFPIGSYPDILYLKHDSRILRQSSNPVHGSWKPSHFSVGQTAQRLTCSIMEKPDTGLDDCLIISEPYSIPVRPLPYQQTVSSGHLAISPLPFSGYMRNRGNAVTFT